MKTNPQQLIIILLALILSACEPTNPPSTSTPVIPRSPLPTETAQPTPTVQPTRISSYTIYVPHRILSYPQEILKNSQHSISQWHRIEAWADYWIECDTPPFDPAAETHWNLIYDDPDNPTESFMVIESGDSFYTTPVSYYGIALDPPAVSCQSTVEPAYAPILLGSGIDRQWLRVRGGQIIKVDSAGAVVASVALQGIPSPEDFDMEKFENFPQSYDYLLNHLADFVQSPDPVNNRAEFDKWFQEQLIPALGPVSEREINIDAYAINSRYALTFTNDRDDHKITGHIHSFYFVSNDVAYFTPCFHTVKSGLKPGQGIMTVCIAMFDNPQLAVANFGNIGIEELFQGRIYRGYMLFNPKLDRPDLDYGEMQPIIESVGEYFDPENYVRFGFGFIEIPNL